jgi:peptide/nickel transport system permease protein
MLARQVLRRVGQMLPVLLLVTVMVFSARLLVPGDPVTAILGPQSQSDPAAIHALQHQLGLDKPVYVQYGHWLAGVLHGNLGISISTHQRVLDIMRERIPVTLQLAAFSALLAVLIAVPLGILAAVRRNSIWDVLASTVSVVGLAVPNFWIGILAILLFAAKLGILPASGYVSVFQNPMQAVLHLLMPALAIGGLAAGQLMRQVRSSVLQVLHQNHVRTAKAKGLTKSAIIRSHVLRNAALPPLTLFGVLLAQLLGGSLIVEQIFLIPGLGQLLVTAVFNRDFPVIQAGVLVAAVVVTVVNLIVDLLYTVVDPRITVG